MSGTVYTVASGKGGVGKTTTSVNLAVALWQEGNAVALVDADIGMANLAAVLDITPEATLHDVLAGRASVDEALVEAQGGNLLVLPGDRSLESFANADPRELRAAVDELTERCDYVIVDTGAGLSYEDVLPLGMAHGVLLVTTPDPAAFGDTQKTMEVADLLGAPIRGLVVTRAVADTDAAAIAGEIGAELLGTIPEDPAVMASTVAGNPLESHAPDSAAAGAYRDLAATLLSGDEEWLEAHPREPAPAPVGDAESAAGPASDDDAGDSGYETGETVAEAADVAIDAEGAGDIGDLLSEPGEDDESGEEPGRESAGEPPAGEEAGAEGTAVDEAAEPGDEDEAAEPDATPADVDESTDDDADRTDGAVDGADASSDRAGADVDDALDDEEADDTNEGDDTDEGDEVGKSVEPGEDEGAEDVEEAAKADETGEDEGAVEDDEMAEDVERRDEEVEESDDGAEATGDEEEEGDEDLEASEDSEDQEDADEVEAEPEAEELGYDDGADWADDQPASEEAEPEEPEKRGGLLGWLGRLF